ncbi:MAG TPA: exodeoxyribonuclease III [Candidatus Polarisedimenticolia bacterium]|nr:exodeoxyribonuclease III [Candidatus Polarisedimenticolia bacterium]
MTIASWNVNSVRARRERLLRWLEKNRPDVVCLQETKVTDADFPLAETTALGYYAVLHGQKGYNGVAILAIEQPQAVERGFGDDGDDAHARFIVATVRGVRVASVYVPNGRAVGSDKWDFKLAWLKRLRAWLDRRAVSEPLVLCGDFNVAPEERDVKNPAFWSGTVLFHPEARRALQEVTSWGLVDVFRRHNQEAGFYSWWDYRMLGFPKNDGLRIDLVLATPPLAERSVAASIDREERKGKLPSDHAPVIAGFNLQSPPSDSGSVHAQSS